MRLPPGQVRVPIAPRAIPAFTRIDYRFHLIHPQTGEPSFVVLSRKEANTRNLLTQISRIHGRVLARAKPVGIAFVEKDFLPEGSPPGLAGAVPLGKVGFALAADQIEGPVFALKPGDSFDLLAAQSINLSPIVQEITQPKHPLTTKTLEAKALEQMKQGHVRKVVQHGLVLTTPKPPQPPDPRRPEPTRIEKEITIAITPTEATQLSAALKADLTLTVVSHSGRPAAQLPPEQEQSPTQNLEREAQVQKRLSSQVHVPDTRVEVPIGLPVAAFDLKANTQVEVQSVRLLPYSLPALRDHSAGDEVAVDSPRTEGSEHYLLDLNDISGRVLRTAKKAGKPFRERDFFPKGTPVQIARTIPVGMLAYPLPGGNLSGPLLYGLRPGDQVGLFATDPLRLEELLSGHQQQPLSYASALAKHAGTLTQQRKHAQLYRIVDRGIVLFVPEFASPGEHTMRTRFESLILAVTPEEAAKLSLAEAAGHTLRLVVWRSDGSGPVLPKPVASPLAIPETEVRLARVTLTETIIGKRRSLYYFPEAGKPPIEVLLRPGLPNDQPRLPSAQPTPESGREHNVEPPSK